MWWRRKSKASAFCATPSSEPSRPDQRSGGRFLKGAAFFVSALEDEAQHARTLVNAQIRKTAGQRGHALTRRMNLRQLRLKATAEQECALHNAEKMVIALGQFRNCQGDSAGTGQQGRKHPLKLDQRHWNPSYATG